MEADDRSPETIELERVLAPLDEEEAERAMRSAEASLTERPRRYRLLGAQLAIEKPQGQSGLPDRLVEVFVADYDNHRSLRLVVGADGGVVGSEVLGYEPPFSADEISEARRLAERDESLARLARREELVVSTFAPSTAPLGERHVGLRYALPEEDLALPVASVLVNLAAGEVLRSDIEERVREGGG